MIIIIIVPSTTTTTSSFYLCQLTITWQSSTTDRSSN